MKPIRLIPFLLSAIMLLAPATDISAGRPGAGSGVHRTNQSASRPGSKNAGRNNYRDQGTSHKPGNHNKPDRKPGNNHKPDRKPGNHKKPGHGGIWSKPGGHKRPGHSGVWSRPGNSAPRPGSWRAAKPRPIRYSGWFNPYPGRWERPLPLPPVRPVAYFRPVASPFTLFATISFGSRIAADIAAIAAAGYNLAATADDALYLTNVSFLNLTWPQVSIYYGDNGMNNTCFYYSSSRPDRSRYNSAYNALVRKYGKPHLSESDSASWWDSEGGYVTLNYGHSENYSGSGEDYYTELVYGTE